MNISTAKLEASAKARFTERDVHKDVTKIGKGNNLIDASEIAPSKGKGNYHKRAMPFDLDDPADVSRLEAMCAFFQDPWSTGREYGRKQWAANWGDLAIKLVSEELEIISADEFAKYIAPVRAQMAQAEKDAEQAQVAEDASDMAYAEMSNKQLRAVLKARGLTTKGAKKALIARLEADDAPEEEPEMAPSEEPEEDSTD